MIVKLKTNWKPISIEIDKTPAKCKGCWKEIFWGKTENWKSMPVSVMWNGDYVLHFFDCSKAKEFKK